MNSIGVCHMNHHSSSSIATEKIVSTYLHVLFGVPYAVFHIMVHVLQKMHFCVF